MLDRRPGRCVIALGAALCALVLVTATPAHAQSGGFVYALQKVAGGTNQIHGFSVDTATGVLTPLAGLGFPVSAGTGAAGTPSETLIYDRLNARLYALNDGSDTISAFAVNRLTGALAALPFNPIALPAGDWFCLAVSPDGAVVTAGDGVALRVASFAITGTSAVAAPGSPVSTSGPGAVSCAFSQDGQYFYSGGNATASVAGFAVNATTGALTALAGSPFGSGTSSVGYATDASGRLFLASLTAGSASAFTTSAGVPTAVSGSPFAPVINSPGSGVVTSSGFYVTADTTGNRVHVRRISGTGSATTLATVSGSPFSTTGTFTNALALDHTGTLLFAANGSSRNITTFRVQSTDPALTLLVTQTFSTVGAAGFIAGIAFAPPVTGGFVYALNNVNGAANQLHGFSVNPSSGALAALAGFPVALGSGASGSPSEALFYDRTNARLFALNDGSDTISAFAVNRTTGTLTALPYSPISLGAGTWDCLATNPSGSVLAAGNAVAAADGGSVATFALSATSATPAPGSPVITSGVFPVSCAFSQDGSYLYAGGFGSSQLIAGFSVNQADGALTPLTGSPFSSGAGNPSGYAVDPSGRLFIVHGSSNQVRAFTTFNGVPTAVTNSPFAAGGVTSGSAGMLTSSGFYMVADGNNAIGVYAIGGADSGTTLTGVAGSRFATGGLLTNTLALDDTSSLLFAGHSNSRNLQTFSINPRTGALTSMNLQGVNAVGAAGTVGGVAFVPLAAASASPITEFPTPTVGSRPRGIVAGPDGNVYFTQALANQYAQITPAGVITEQDPTSAYPHGITAGPDGNLWYTTLLGDRIGRLSFDAGALVGQTEFSPLAANSLPAMITAGPDGALWFTEAGTNKIGRITADGFGTMTEFSAGLTPGAQPFGITLGPDNNLWFTERLANKIGRITPAGVITEFPIPTADSAPSDIVKGPDGALWFTQTGASKIGRITTSGVITEFSGPTVAPGTITLGPDGNLWYWSSTKLGRMTPTGSVTEYTPPSSPVDDNELPGFITAGPDGNIWFAEGNPSKIGMLRLSNVGLSIVKNGSGSGTVTAAGTGVPASLSCGTTCGGTFSTGTLVTLTATPAAGSRFQGWSGGGCGGTGACVVTVSNATVVRATFSLAATLSVVKFGGGTIADSVGGGISCGTICSSVRSAGTQVTLTATPNTGYVFTGWNGGGCSGTGTCIVSLTAATAVTATFGFTVSPAALPGGTAGVPYSQLISGTGTAPFAFTVLSGALPSGLALSNASGAGLLSGVPAVTGTFPFTVTGLDALTGPATQIYSLTIGCPTIILSSLPNPVVGNTYTQTVTQSGGIGTATFAVTSGTLPAGLTLSPAGGLTGTATTAGPATFTITATDANGCAGSLAYTLTVGAPPTITLDKTALVFGAASNGTAFVSQTGPQTVRLTQSGSGTVTWTATSNQPWLAVSPTSGSGSATLTVTVAASAGLPISGTSSGAIAFSFTGAGNTAGPITAALTTFPSGTSLVPFGVMDTPVDNSLGVTGSIAVTGWALDDLEVQTVRILRDPVAGEGSALIFIGNAVLVDLARLDVAALNPTAPRNTRAGWGYLLLTNFLPNQGNGTFRLHAFADDVDGHSTLLGSKTITCANATAVLPFGAIDTPDQGAVVSGANFANFGWVLSRGPALAFPPNGTVAVVIDGVFGATPTGWVSRADLTALFPATIYPGVTNALGVATLDTTALANGVHTIAWVVTDNTGHADGIGSRFFTVANGASAVIAGETLDVTAGAGNVRVSASVEAGPAYTPTSVQDEVSSAPLDRTAIAGRRGYDQATPFQSFVVGPDDRATIHGEELDRFEVHLDAASTSPTEPYTGYLRLGDELGPLPTGSHLDAARGVFTWQPGPGFLYVYDLVFVRWREGHAVGRREVRVVINPKGSNRVGPQVMIDKPASGPPSPRLRRGLAVARASEEARAEADEAPAEVAQPFVVAGWAIDPDAGVGTGIDTLHVWAYPVSAPESPIFLGATAYGGRRPDVAAIFGDRFRDSGYGITVDRLPSGTYDLAVFAWSTAAGRFVPAKTVRVVVR